MYIHPKGSPSALVWLIIDVPLSTDKDRGYLFSGGAGFVYHKMLEEVGITDYYVTCRRPDTEHLDSFRILENDLNHYRPPIIIMLDDVGEYFCDELKRQTARPVKSQFKSEVEKYAGSLLISTKLQYSHYILPTYGPLYASANWKERDIITFLDLGKARSEIDYFMKYGSLESLPQRKLVYDFSGASGYENLCSYLDRYEHAQLLSDDIETVYPRKESYLYPHPGIPVTIGLADCKSEGISFELFRDDIKETKDLWRRLYSLCKNVKRLGQNFFHYDLFRYDSLGFLIPPENVTDTYLRHRILWPELEHSLQFMTRQYTREPYYKDEGAGWSPKNMNKLKRYNCLDVCCTYEVYEKQEEEFNERAYLR